MNSARVGYVLLICSGLVVAGFGLLDVLSAVGAPEATANLDGAFLLDVVQVLAGLGILYFAPRTVDASRTDAD